MKSKVALISLLDIDLGIRYISSYLNSKGYSTYVISFGQWRMTQEILCGNYLLTGLLRHRAYPDKDAQLLINLISELRPDLIGISVPSTSFITASILTQKIKERLNIPIVWGGIHPTLCPEDCIQHADIVCVGEGEYPMHELTQKLENNERITAIKNLWIKHRDGSIEKNEVRDLILNLDSLPYPDFVNFGNKFLIDRGKIIPDPIIVYSYIKNGYPITSSRGCPFNCSFCCNGVLKVIYKDKGPYLRRRTPENVIDELVYVRKNREVTEIRFCDDNFTYDREWIERFCQLYIKKVSAPFTCNTHPKYTDKKIIQMLARAGLRQLALGIQSGSESFCRERFKREQSNEEIIEFANVLKRLGIVPRYNVIVDNPYESDADTDATAELLLRLSKPYIATVFSLCYLPKTELTNQALRDKLITEEDIEGKDNKALNNSYMFIDLAKDKKRFFWDIIVAMAVSDFFSRRLIRRCKHSRFFRYHPRFLLSLVRLYLRISLISPIAFFEFLSKRQANADRITKLFNKAPRPFLPLAKLYLRVGIFWKDKSDIFTSCNLAVNIFEKFITVTNNQAFKDKTKIDLLVFPKDSLSTVSKSFYLKIRQGEPSRPLLSLNLLIELAGMRPLMFPRNRPALWEIDLEIGSSQAEMEIDLSFPHLFFTLNGIRKEASIKDARNITEKGLYLLYLFLYDGFQKMYILKNCIIIRIDDLLNLDKENKLLNSRINHLLL